MRGVDATQLQQLARCDLSERAVTLGAFSEMCRRAGNGRYRAVPPARWVEAITVAIGIVYVSAGVLVIIDIIHWLAALIGLGFLPDWVRDAWMLLFGLAILVHFPTWVIGLIEADLAISRSAARLLRGQCPVCKYRMSAETPDPGASARPATCPECGNAAVAVATPEVGAASNQACDTRRTGDPTGAPTSL